MGSVAKVVVVGAGTMGSQIALQCSVGGGHEVALVDSRPEALEAAIEQNRRTLARSVERGRLTGQAASAALDRIHPSSDPTAAARDADIAIEAVFEDLEAKREVFRTLDAALPEASLLTSNSSSIPISSLAAVTSRPDRCCNTHFFHPVTVMELCEVVMGPETSEATVERAMEFVRGIGRIPVLLRKEIHGFIVNRILFAASLEAMRLLEGGYATVEDIDLAVKKGLNWPMGIFELLDFSGVDVFVGALEDRARVEGGEGAPQLLKEMVRRGELGRKSGRGFHDYRPSVAP